MKVVDPAQDTNVDLRDIKIIKKLGYARPFAMISLCTEKRIHNYEKAAYNSQLASVMRFDLKQIFV